MKNYYFMIVFMGCSMLLWSQEKTITGIVTDSQNMPLPGASVLEKGTTNGVQTDYDGKFSLPLNNEGAVCVISFVGFVTQEIIVGRQTNLNVVLQEDVSALNEVVVVGYGVQKKVNLTGSVETVKADEITRQPVSQTSQALAGLVPGLTVIQRNGQPGSDDATFRIRGLGTLGDSDKNDPLILVDGIPDSINGVDPNDIESISVLKDASASAIYGSRAANGVILIVTKRGKIGKLTTSFNTNIGFQSAANNLKFVNSLGFMEAFNTGEPGAFSQDVIDAYRAGDGVGTELLPDTDWVDLLFSDPGVQQSHSISMRGGSEKTRVSASLSYLDQDGNVPNYNFKRYNGRFNIDLKVLEKLDVSFDLNLRRDVNSAPVQNLQGITRQAYRLQPLFVAINDNGTYGPGFSGANPVAKVRASGALDQSITNYFRGVFKAVYRPIEDLSVAMTYSPAFNDTDRDAFNVGFVYYENSLSPANTDGLKDTSLFKSTSTSFQDNFNTIITYRKDFGDHDFSVLAGYEFLKFKSENFSARRINFVFPEFRQLNNGDEATQLNSGSATQNGLESVFGRINYTYKDRYLFEANVRRDASSRFAPNFRSQTFPSFSVGWRVSEEEFFPEDSFVSSLKFRSSWGQLGNQIGTSDFGYTSLFGVGNANVTIGGVSIVGGAQATLANTELQWETGESLNFATDARFFNNKLSLTAEYFVRTTKDILLRVTIPTSVGFTAPTQNAGEVENRGWDFSTEWKDNIGNFNYGINFNYSFFDNEIKDLGGLDQLPPDRTLNHIGSSINSIFGLKSDGLYQESDFDTNGDLLAGLPIPQFGAVQAGDIKYVDFNDDDQINNDDRTIIGSDLDTQSWAVDVYAEYKGFDFSVSLNGVGGRDVVLEGDAGYPFFNAGKIQEWQLDFWTPTNTGAQYPRVKPGSASPNWRASETWMFDASYVRLRNVTLGYSVQKNTLEKIGLSKLRIYVSGQNLLTFDNMPDGIDPTVPNFSNGGFYPVTKIFSMGLSVVF
ncbi:MAG TPA: TonB-dependent receptor [Mariniflexile sp.]